MSRAEHSLFLAAAPDPRAGEALLAMQDALRQCLPGGLAPRWIGPEDLHLTLRFFGAADASQQRGIEALAAAAASRYPPRTLAYSHVAAWPPSRPRVLVAEYLGDAPLTALAAELENGARRLGFAAEPRPFCAHITLARLRAAGALPALPDLASTVAYPVAALTLFDRGGATRYLALQTWPLAG